MKTIAVMQPYIFPYIGYFQLISNVEKFVVYDDVTFIKQGWINRNNILINGSSFLFTVPLEKASSFNTIRETKLNPKLYSIWAEKFVRTIEQNYKKAPCFEQTFEIINNVFMSNCEGVSELAMKSLVAVSDYLGLKAQFVKSSTIYNNSALKGECRILDICKKEKAEHYINLIGGLDLYSKTNFYEQGLKLSFIKSNITPYPQFKKDAFVPWLSIIDLMMFNNPLEIYEMLNNYELV